MTKETAHKILSEYLEHQPPPIHDRIMYRVNNDNGLDEYTFKGLLAICYDM